MPDNLKRPSKNKKENDPVLNSNLLPELSLEMQKLQMMIDSGMLPDYIDTPQKAFLVIQKGKELGFPPIASLEHIYPVDKKTGLDFTALAFTLSRNKVTWKTLQDFDDCDTPADAKMIPGFKNKVTKIEFRKGDMVEHGIFYLHECYKIVINRAGDKLISKWNYKNYLTSMIWYRAFSRGGKRISPESTMGCYLIDEIGGLMDDKGNYVSDIELQAPPLKLEGVKEELRVDDLGKMPEVQPEKVVKKKVAPPDVSKKDKDNK